MSASLIGKDGTNIATTTNGVPVFTGDAGVSPAGVGSVRLMTENDAGTILGTPYLKSPETSDDYRLRVGMDTLLLSDTFNGTAQNTAIWSYAATTLTATQPGGYVQFGTVQGTASTHGAYMRTWKYFPLMGTAPLSIEFTGGSFIASLVVNEAFYAGMGLPTAGGTIPTDGTWFKMTSAGLFGEMQYNGGTLTQITLSNSQIALASIKKFAIVVGESSVEFWIDDVLYGDLDVPAGQGQPFMQGSLPVFMQKICTGVVSNTNVIRMTDVTISLMDIATNKPWSHQQAEAGLHIWQTQNGTAISSPLTFTTNNTLPTTALPVNTALTANLPNLLGGQGLATLWNLAATDMIMQQWLNPAGTINITGRTLFLTGMTISASSATAAWTAPAAGAHIFQWSLGFGHTATTAATTTDSASFTAGGTTKGRRTRPIGTMSWATGTAPIGTMPDRGDLNVTFQTPIVVNPGEYVTTIVRMLNGAATATGGMHFMIAFDGYFQ
jgi:hypothetical protein